MKALIAGAGGQLGRMLQQSVPDAVQILAPDEQDFDICNPQQLHTVIAGSGADVLINAAAYTAVDQAEKEPELAQRINAQAPRWLAEAADAAGLRMVQVSTDFVFDGQASQPYLPDAEARPLGVYGASKLAGDLAVREVLGDRSLVVRTAWVYAPGGRNFVRTMLKLMQSREELGVVADQLGTPTHAYGLAVAIWKLLESEASGFHHWTDAGVASWYDFAVAIGELAAQRWPDRSWARVRPIRSEDYPTPAQRPAYGVLDKSATWSATGVPPHWRTRLADALMHDPEDVWLGA